MGKITSSFAVWKILFLQKLQPNSPTVSECRELTLLNANTHKNVIQVALSRRLRKDVWTRFISGFTRGCLRAKVDEDWILSLFNRRGNRVFGEKSSSGCVCSKPALCLLLFGFKHSQQLNFWGTRSSPAKSNAGKPILKRNLHILRTTSKPSKTC